MSRPATGIVALVLCAALVLTISNGLRSSFGLFLTPMSLDIGVSRETFALAIAIQGLVWGISQPVFGALADRHGAVGVVLLGSVIYVAGLLWMAWADGALGLHLSQGVLVALGISATGFAVVLGPVGRAVPPEKRSMALGIAAAGGSFGQFALAPVGGALIDGVGWSMALIAYCGIAAMMIPCLIGMRGSHTPPEGSAQTLGEALAEARNHSGFWLLCGGFFVCGFHVYFIATHLPPFLTDAGLAPMMGATAIAVIGLGNIVGTFAAGWLGDRHRKKHVLSLFYLGRAAVLGMLPRGAGDRGERAGVLRPDGPALARHRAAHQRPRRPDLRAALSRRALRHRLLQPPAGLLPRRLARGLRLRYDRLLRCGVAGRGGARRDGGRAPLADPRQAADSPRGRRGVECFGKHSTRRQPAYAAGRGRGLSRVHQRTRSGTPPGRWLRICLARRAPRV